MNQNQQQRQITFTGLSLSSNGGELPPGGSPVFHNCDIASDGDVIRRPGTNLVSVVDQSVPGSAWSHVVKTKKGTEYLVTVTQLRITIQLISAVNGTAFSRIVLVKTGVFSSVLTDVNFVSLPIPYDRLLILTPNHPPVQLSFLERTMKFTCTNAGTQQLTAPSLSTDSAMWRDTTVNGTFLADFATNEFFILGTKSPGFLMTVPGLTMALNQVREMTLVQISWQWWAESIVWNGKDFMQNTVRYSVTAIDQNVKIPADLITDLDPQYLNSPYRGILLSLGSNFIDFPPLRTPSPTPAAPAEWSHGSGQRYNFAANNPLIHSPFFATFQGIEAVGTQTAVTFWRTRELRFNANTGVLPSNLSVFVGGVLKTWRTTFLTTHPVGDYWLYSDTFTTQRNIANTPADGLTKATFIVPYANGQPISLQAEVTMTNTETRWLGSSARKVLYTDLPLTGGILDGCYVQAFGLGAFADYFRGRFPSFGCLFRDRLVLKTGDESIDQLALSATSDVLSPGNFYSFFQITDALKGTVDDPFSINITAKSREKITALLGWQQSLFVFTSVSTYSVTGGELFGPDSYTTGLVASYGAFNARCVVATNLTVLFLNRFGLFDLLNKNNTTDYGSFERSEPVRPLFLNKVIEPEQDSLPWLCLNDTNNKVYLGLPLAGATAVCKIILSLNLSWNSWSTIASSVPFSATAAVQLLNWTMLIVKNGSSNDIQVLQMDATHNLDYVKDLVSQTLPAVIEYPAQIELVNSSVLKTVPLTTPSPPVLREYANLTKVDTTYYSALSQQFTFLNPRNWMFDVPDLAPFLGPSPEGLESTLVMHTTQELLPLYPRVTSITTRLVTVQRPVSGSGVEYDAVNLIGTAYPSVFATTTFQAQSMGRLKRLKRLHMLFDNTSVNYSRYYDYPNRQINSAIVLVRSNYGGDADVVDTQLIGDYLRLDAQNLDITPSASAEEEISIPLEGYGCDYQAYVCSTGGDAFKLKAFEFDVTPQRTKTYIR